ncbi:Suf-domain-containing protein [Gloeophyllum trabeum ATCC 11539]|uniref:mRNA 3'-end-processing protein RNA14 n=1 Tax=Gloeophyllum trabeum (strain ATCC 11539 / FP-39264 / Madison 617) TaxID=670483 RepID=S7RXZ3_GLOTA|nr:Suf-domain-containing protein [Gloeophyllum trabeum ATCC 11539]EPQ59815.1 Suf-domain-containing protein [Gloeophyllum trabeum ATCC 11539]
MSEPPQAVSTTEDSMTDVGEKTQPAEDILKALQALQNASQPQPPSGEGSQETIAADDVDNTNAASMETVATEPAEPSEPPSEWDLLQTRLHDNPHDTEAWHKLVNLAESSGDIEKIKTAYDQLLQTYPNTSAAQIAYISHFLDSGEFQQAQALFIKFLRTSPDVDLWKFYLTYVRRMNTSPATRDEVQKAYEFALKTVGQDKDSGDIWNDYIQFIKSREISTTWEEQQKMDALRKIYHRAIPIPLENHDKLWSEYEAFEMGLNKVTGKKFIQDLSPSHMQARAASRQLQRHVALLFPPAPPSNNGRPALYLPSPPTFAPPERALVGQWKAYLKWEESNPLEMDEKDKATFIQRVQMVYRKAVIRMRFFAEIWYMAYVWTKSIGKLQDAVALLEAGIEANPSSFLLNFAYAEELEIRGEKEKVHKVYENLLETLSKQLEELEKKITPASSFSANMPTTGNDSGNAANGFAAPAEGGAGSNNSSFSSQNSDEAPSKTKELADRRTEYGLVYIMYIRFARRAENEKSARAIFSRARKDRWTPWEVYEAHALMEYHCQKETLATSRIFEAGLKAFGHEVEFVLRYLGFLISINDENNARALFERVIGTFPPDKARPLWERWARYVYQYMNLETALNLEKRIAEIYPNDPPIKRFAQRHTYLGTDAIAARDLGFSFARPPAPAPSTSARGNALGPNDTAQSLLGAPNQNTSQAFQAPPPSSGHKRAPSPDHKRRDDGPGRVNDGPPVYKRARASPPPRERDRDRWDGPPRRYGSPAWDRDRERRGPPPRRMEMEREEEKPVVLPPILSSFIGQLPSAAAFNAYGEPAFRTDDLMQVFRNAIIPSVTRPRSPPPPPRPTRPPPDYGPYQGPGGGRGGRRY